jgi:hypothetical protein
MTTSLLESPCALHRPQLPLLDTVSTVQKRAAAERCCCLLLLADSENASWSPRQLLSHDFARED